MSDYTERDLLIKLTEKVEGLERQMKDLLSNVRDHSKDIGNIRDRLILVEQESCENTKLRRRVNGALFTAVAGLVTGLVVLVEFIIQWLGK